MYELYVYKLLYTSSEDCINIIVTKPQHPRDITARRLQIQVFFVVVELYHTRITHISAAIMLCSGLKGASGIVVICMPFFHSQVCQMTQGCFWPSEECLMQEELLFSKFES